MARINLPNFVLQIHNSKEGSKDYIIKGDTLAELLSKLPLLVIEIQADAIKEAMERIATDDIPF